MYYVYVLKSLKDGNLYKGSTADLKKRIERHNTGQVPSTKNRRPFKLIYYEAYQVKSDAIKRELFIKTLEGGKNLHEQLAGSLKT
ncbi:MAG TPA: GIY-YIG nuclease family protein [Patescibacteria group bacterium]|nr:GIY-YIG nuclease family protein [Patescibacteria group bacterium]